MTGHFSTEQHLIENDRHALVYVSQLCEGNGERILFAGLMIACRKTKNTLKNDIVYDNGVSRPLTSQERVQLDEYQRAWGVWSQQVTG